MTPASHHDAPRVPTLAVTEGDPRPRATAPGLPHPNRVSEGACSRGVPAARLCLPREGRRRPWVSAGLLRERLRASSPASARRQWKGAAESTNGANVLGGVRLRRAAAAAGAAAAGAAAAGAAAAGVAVAAIALPPPPPPRRPPASSSPLQRRRAGRPPPLTPPPRAASTATAARRPATASGGWGWWRWRGGWHW